MRLNESNWVDHDPIQFLFDASVLYYRKVIFVILVIILIYILLII